MCPLIERFARTATSAGQENSYDFSINQKGYVVKPAGSDFLIAGTYFDATAPTYGSVHTINTNALGYIGTTTLFQQQGNDIYDTRVADMVFIGSHQYAIVAGSANVTTSGYNNIRIQIVDNFGVGNAYYTIVCNDPTYPSLYPIRALYNPDLNTLHICGYAADGNAATLPTWGGSAGDKVAFVLNFDITTHTVSNLQFFNSGFSPAPTSATFNYDFDIATRMKYYTPPGGISYLIVTGSANMVHQPNTIPPTTDYVSGSNIMLLKASALTIEQNMVICGESATQGTNAEYGNDLLYEENEKRLYVLSNTYTWPGLGDAVGPKPNNFMITALELDFNTTPISLNISSTDSRIVQTTSMASSGYAWGHQFLTSSDHNAKFVVSGYQNDAPAMYPTPVQPSNDNINGFLSTIDFHLAAGAIPTFTGAVSDRWTTMLNFTGTLTSTSTSSYYLMGGALSNLAWMPDNATEVGMEKIQVAPYERPSDSYLKLKFSHTDAAQMIPFCPVAANPDLSSSYTFGLSNIHTNGTSSVTPTFSGTSPILPTIGTNAYTDVTPGYGLGTCNAGFGYKRTGNTTLNAATTKTTIHPNPAQDYISVTLSGVSVTEKVFVMLYDVTGRMVSELYNGPAGTMNSKLQLPNIASGLYTIQVKTSSKILTKEKLSIQ